MWQVPYRFNCSGQSHGRLCSRHCVQTGLVFISNSSGWENGQSLTFLHCTVEELVIGLVTCSTATGKNRTFCFRERQELQAIVIREGFFVFDGGMIWLWNVEAFRVKQRWMKEGRSGVSVEGLTVPFLWRMAIFTFIFHDRTRCSS